MTRYRKWHTALYRQKRAETLDAITFWQGAVIHAKDEDTRQFALDRIAALRCKITVLEYEHGERSWADDVRAVRAMQDDQDAEELF